MKTTATISSVRGYFKAETYSLRLELSGAALPCYRYDDNGELVESTTNALYIPVSVLIAQVAKADARFGQWFGRRRDATIGTKEHPFAPSVAETILTGVILDIESTKHSAGDEYTASDGSIGHYQGDCFTHEIVGVTFTPDVNVALNKYMPKDRAQLIADLF